MDLTQLTASQLSDPSRALIDMLSEQAPNDPEVWDRATMILTEITNGYGKDLPPPLDRANSGSLQRRDSTSAASGLDSHETVEKQTVADREHAPYRLQTGSLHSPAAAPSSDADNVPELQSMTDCKPAPNRLDVDQSKVASGAANLADGDPASHSRSPSKATPGHQHFATEPQVNQAQFVGAPHDRSQHASISAPKGSPASGYTEHPAFRPQAAVKPPAISVPKLSQASGYTEHPAFGPHAAVRAPGKVRPQDSTKRQATDKPQPSYPRQDIVKARDAVRPQSRVVSVGAVTVRPETAVRPQDRVVSSGTMAVKAADTVRPQDRLVSSGTAAMKTADAVNLQDLVTPQESVRAQNGVRDQDKVKPQNAFRPQELNGWQLGPGQQPPLSALPDDIAAWDTPRLEQMPVRLPEPRFNAHLLHSASKTAAPAGKADHGSSAQHDSPRVAQSKGNEGVIIEDSVDGVWPAHVLVQCNGNQGKFLLAKQSMVCNCKLCQTKAAKLGLLFVDMTPTEFERHSGNASISLKCTW